MVGRIHDKRSFGVLRERGVKRRSGPIVVTAVLDDGSSEPRVAYALPRAVGSAVHRNRLRRRLRAIAGACALEPGSYLISASPGATALSYDELAAHVRAALPTP